MHISSASMSNNVYYEKEDTMDFNMQYPDIPPGKKRLKKIYLQIMMFFVGRAFQSAYRIDRNVRKEFDSLPKKFAFMMKIHPNGPGLMMQKDSKGRLKFIGHAASPVEVNILFRNI